MQRLRAIDRRLVTILLIVFVQMIGASMALPILPLYARREFAMDTRIIPWLLTAFFAAQFIAGPTIGRLSDRYGRVPILIISQIGTAIAFAMIAGANSVWMLFIARIFDGITGGNIIVAQAYVTDITKPEKRTEALGLIMAAFGLGFIFGPALGGLLSGVFGPRVPFALASVAATLVVILTRFTLDESLSADQRAANRAVQMSGDALSWRSAFSNSPLLSVLIIGFVIQFGVGVLQGTFALWGEAVLFNGYSPSATDLGIGLLLTVFGLTQLFMQAVGLRPLLARFGEVDLIIAGSLLRSIGSIFLALITIPILGAPVVFLFAAGVAISTPTLQGLATQMVGEEVHGRVLGMLTAVTSLATIFSTLLAGFLFNITPVTQFWLAAVLSVLAIIPALQLRRDRGTVES